MAISFLARLLLKGGRKAIRMPKVVQVDPMATQKAKEAVRTKFKKTGGKGMKLKEADTTKFKVDE